MVADGSYTVILDQSSVHWAGKKPLIEGYINSGSLALTDGNIESIDGTANGMFGIDMNHFQFQILRRSQGKNLCLKVISKERVGLMLKIIPTLHLRL